MSNNFDSSPDGPGRTPPREGAPGALDRSGGDRADPLAGAPARPSQDDPYESAAGTAARPAQANPPGAPSRPTQQRDFGTDNRNFGGAGSTGHGSSGLGSSDRSSTGSLGTSPTRGGAAGTGTGSTDRSTAGSSGTTTAQESGSLTGEAKAQAKEMADQVEERARAKGQELRDQVEQKADEQKSRAAGTADALSAAIRAAGDSLRERQENRLGDFTDELATHVDRFSGYLRDNDIRGLLTNLEDVARRNPASFLGSTLAAGLVAGRFLRSSADDGSRDGQRDWGDRGHRTEGDQNSYRAGGEQTHMDSAPHRPPSHQEFGTAASAPRGDGARHPPEARQAIPPIHSEADTHE